MRVVMILVPLIFAAAFPFDVWFLQWALRKLLAEQPTWISAAVVVSVMLTAFGFACLLDKKERQEKQSQL